MGKTQAFDVKKLSDDFLKMDKNPVFSKLQN